MRISDWNSDVGSSDLRAHRVALDARDLHQPANRIAGEAEVVFHADLGGILDLRVGAAERGGQPRRRHRAGDADLALAADFGARDAGVALIQRSEEQTSELQSLMRISYAAFCLKKKNNK